MIKFDWMTILNYTVYYDIETSRVWATITATYNPPPAPPLYEFEGDLYLELDKLKKVVENRFSKYGSKINSVKE